MDVTVSYSDDTFGYIQIEITVSYSDSTFGYIQLFLVSASKVFADMKPKRKCQVYTNEKYRIYDKYTSTRNKVSMIQKCI